jgi:LPS-assembly lipoprotein
MTRPLLIIVPLALGLLLSACGFEPLYGDRRGTTPAGQARGTAPDSVLGDLEATKVATISDRVGQLVRNALVDRINPGGEPDQPRYVVVVTLRETIEQVLQSRDTFSTASNLRIDAAWEIRDTVGNVLGKGFGRTVNRYNTVQSQYATLEAQADARQRGARELAEEIRAKLAVWYSARRGL